ncbi:MAG: dTDP-glucose 4,6-dehydratase [Planctomycetota bacterium]
MSVWLVTGGAGFIGSCFIRSSLALDPDLTVLNLDKLTYAGHLKNLEGVPADRYSFCHAAIEDGVQVARLLNEHRPSAVINFAAESHVDRSIDDPASFLQTNVVGTVTLLERTLAFFRELSGQDADAFRMLHVSTDEVYGSLGDVGKFVETTPYQPNSPYAASKASSDMFVRAYHETYGLPTVITNCSNNYGPYQFPEKLIPTMILNAAEGKELPVYGDGKNVRDWLFVDDHCQAIRHVLSDGRIGETYNIGGDSERTNLEVVHTICDLVDESLQTKSSRNLLRFVTDRPGHDRRYAIDASKIRDELGWTPTVTFEEGLRRTVQWCLKNDSWIKAVTSGDGERKRLGTPR